MVLFQAEPRPQAEFIDDFFGVELWNCAFKMRVGLLFKSLQYLRNMTAPDKVAFEVP